MGKEKITYDPKNREKIRMARIIHGAEGRYFKKTEDRQKLENRRLAQEVAEIYNNITGNNQIHLINQNPWGFYNDR